MYPDNDYRKMRMLRWITCSMLEDKKTNECIHEKIGVALIEDKMEENRLRWFMYCATDTSKCAG